MAVAGAANGAFTLDHALAEGHAAGGGEGAAPNAPRGLYRIAPMWPKSDAKGRSWIDLQNDVTLKDVALAAREGYVAVEHLKRYTTLGMATDQGKTSNVNGLAAMAAITGRAMGDMGTTTYRPPYVPTPMGVIAGRCRGALMNPLKRLTLEAEHRADDAVFREYGGWLRPAWYGAGDPDLMIAREALRARESVALFDGSSLGKIELIGPDAAKLADFNSYNRLSTLKTGRIRYGFMLSETGVVYDDGVTLRLGEDRFLVSCSSGHADAVVTRLELLRQDRFEPSRVFIHDTTAHWATLTLSGPRSRDLLASLDLDVALDDESLPHMAFASGAFEGAPMRIARVSFTGDRSYELSVPCRRARRLREKIVAKLPAFDGGLLGSEALMILRAEKGFVIVGKDTDGHTMPHDLGVGGPRENRKDEYVGKRSLFTEFGQRPAPQTARRPQRSRWRAAAADRSACRNRRRAAPLARLCNIELHEPDAQAAGRGWPRRERLCADGRSRARLSSRRPSASRPSPAQSRSIRKERASMRERDWRPARFPEGSLIPKPRLAMRVLDGLGATLISGDLDAAIAALAPGAPLLGLYASAPEGAHALRIARDRALLVTPAPLSAPEGWRPTGESGWCATPVDDGWAAIAIEGEDAPLVLMQATSADLVAGSPSAAVRVFGTTCLLAQMPAGFRLQVECMRLEGLLAWLDGA